MKKNNYGVFFEQNPLLAQPTHIYSGKQVKQTLNQMLKDNPTTTFAGKIKQGIKNVKTTNAYSGDNLDITSSKFMQPLDKKHLAEHVGRYMPHNQTLKYLVRYGAKDTVRHQAMQGKTMSNYQVAMYSDYEAHINPTKHHSEWTNLTKVYAHANDNQKTYASSVKNGDLAKEANQTFKNVQSPNLDKLHTKLVKASQRHNQKLQKTRNPQLDKLNQLSTKDPQKAMTKLHQFNEEHFKGLNSLNFMNSEITYHVDSKDNALKGLNSDIRHDELRGTDKELKRDKNIKKQIKPLKLWIYFNSEHLTARNVKPFDVKGMIHDTYKNVIKDNQKQSVSALFKRNMKHRFSVQKHAPKLHTKPLHVVARKTQKQQGPSFS